MGELEIAGKAVDIAKDLGLFQKVKSALVKQPDPAAAKLNSVFEQLSAIYSAVETELATLLSITGWKDMDRVEFAQNRARLVRLDPDSLRARFREVRSHCKTIGNIYDRFLNPWFGRILKKNEHQVLSDLFCRIRQSDASFVNTIDRVAIWIGNRAERALDALDAQNFEALEHIIAKARVEAKPLRKSLANSWTTLNDLKAEFTERSGAVPK